MILWYLFYLVFVIGGLLLFMHLTMPRELRTIKITLAGLNAALEETLDDMRAIRNTLRDKPQ